MCQKHATAESKAADDPLIKALSGAELTPDERDRAAQEVREIEQTLGEPPAAVVEMLENAGVDVPVVGGDDGV